MSFGQHFTRRDFVRAAGPGGRRTGRRGRLSASRATPGGDRRLATADPEVPNEEIARILKELFGDRPIRSGNKGNISLDMPAVAEDGRVVPVIIESNLPMTPEHYVKGVHLIVDHNPDPHLAAFHLTPAIGRSPSRPASR